MNLGEGDALTMTGTLSLNTWEGKDGTERSGLKIVASKAEAITPPSLATGLAGRLRVRRGCRKASP